MKRTAMNAEQIELVLKGFQDAREALKTAQEVMASQYARLGDLEQRQIAVEAAYEALIQQALALLDEGKTSEAAPAASRAPDLCIGR